VERRLGVTHRIFIVSPARTDGKRAGLLFNEGATFDLARRLRAGEGAELGEVFSFLSGLYFRGKLAYARRFARPPARLGGCFVITSDAGMLAPEARVDLARLKRFAETPIDLAEPRYVEPLVRTAREVLGQLPAPSEVVLLGSIATAKYVDLLLDCFGSRLAFPREFVGRGDMSRGGLMLRAVEAGAELDYASLATTTARKGARPPKLLAKGGRTRAQRRAVE
jgi:hypothetical protein